MLDEWDVYPLIPPPNYPISIGEQICPILTPEEEAAEKERVAELCERIHEEHKRECEEIHRQWLRQRVDWVRDKIKFLHDYQRQRAATQQSRRATGRSRVQGSIYLGWCPQLEAYKIGQTRNLERRIAKLRLVLDPSFEYRVKYRTVAFPALLEMALHCHYRHFHVESDKSKELFRLPDDEVSGFEARTRMMERHLLKLETFHLKALLPRFEAECQESP